MSKTRLVILIVIVFSLCLSACVPVQSAATTTDEPFSVVASFYPLYIAALNIIGQTPGVTLSMLAPPDTGCLHDYQLRPQDMAALERCDLFVINGAGLEAFLGDITQQYPTLPLVTATDGIALLPYEETGASPDDDHEHEHDGQNPHAWVSAALYIRYVENIRDGLVRADPAHGDTYRRNAAAHIDRLNRLNDDMRRELKALPNREIVTFHEAFAYFAKEFDLHVAAVVQREPGQNPSPKELADTIDLVRQAGVKALFAEPQYAPAAAETIARETGARIFSLDPVVTGEMTPDAYETAMRQNIETLKQALG